MAIKVKNLSDNTLVSTTYLTGALDTILAVGFDEGRRTKPYPSISSLYPVIMDIHDDGSIMSLEIFIRIPKWRVETHLELPRIEQVGRIAITEINESSNEPVFRLNPDRALLFIDSTPFGLSQIDRHIQVADQMIISLTRDSLLTGLWLLNLPHEVIEIGLSEAT